MNEITKTQVPPQAVEAEMSVLGGIMLDSDVYYKVVPILSSNMFYKTAHRTIYSVIQVLAKVEKASLDMVTVSDKLKTIGRLDEIGGVYYLTQLCEAVPSSANIEYHAKIIKEKYLLRQLINGMFEIQKDTYWGDPRDIAERLSKLSIIGVDYQNAEIFEDWHTSVLKTFAEIEEPVQQGRIKTIKCMRKLMEDIKPGELVVIGGHSGHGKTALMTQLILENAEKEWGLIFSMEMKKTQLIQRILCQAAEMNTIRLANDDLNPDEIRRYDQVSKDLKIRIIEKPNVSPAYIEAMAQRKKIQSGLSVIGIDYLQLMNLADGDNQELKISNTTKYLKRLAKEFNIPIILLSQLARNSEQKRGRPHVSLLKYSGAIEQDADKIIFTWLPNIQDKTEAKIIIDKWRNGTTGEIDVYFKKECVKFLKE